MDPILHPMLTMLKIVRGVTPECLLCKDHFLWHLGCGLICCQERKFCSDSHRMQFAVSEKLCKYCGKAFPIRRSTTATETCGFCEGAGRWKSCICSGRGWYRPANSGIWELILDQTGITKNKITCRACKGSGIPPAICEGCNGTGKVARWEWIPSG